MNSKRYTQAFFATFKHLGVYERWLDIPTAPLLSQSDVSQD